MAHFAVTAYVCYFKIHFASVPNMLLLDFFQLCINNDIDRVIHICTCTIKICMSIYFINPNSNGVLPNIDLQEIIKMQMSQ